MHLCSQSCSSGWPAVVGPCVCLSFLRDRNFNTGHYMQNFQPNSFIPAMFIDTIDFYHFIPLCSDFDLVSLCIVLAILIDDCCAFRADNLCEFIY